MDACGSAGDVERACSGGDADLARARNAAVAAQCQCAAVDGRGGAGERLGARRQCQSTGAADDAGVGGRAVGDRQRSRPQRDVAVGDAVERDDAGAGGGGRDVEGPSRVGEVDLARARNGTGPAQCQRAGIDGGDATVSVGAGKRQRAAAILGERAGAADHARVGRRIGAVEHKCCVVGDAAGNAAGGAAVADLQRAGADRSDPGVGIGTGECQRAGTLLGEVEGAGRAVLHDARERGRGGIAHRQGVAGSAAVVHRAGAGERADGLIEVVEGQRPAVRDRARGRKCVGGAPRERRAAVDGGRARIGIGTGERERARAGLGEGAGAADDPGKGNGVAAVEHERGVVGDVTDDTASRGGIAELQRAVGDGGATV
jgi:hypothetical protein